MVKGSHRDESPQRPTTSTVVDSTTSPSVVGDAVYRTCAALSTWLGGASQACASSFAELSDRLTPENSTRMGVSNGFIEGIAAGNARFFEEMAKASRNTFEVLQQPRTSTEAVIAVDYERLSKMVAEELRKHPE